MKNKDYGSAPNLCTRGLDDGYDAVQSSLPCYVTRKFSLPVDLLSNETQNRCLIVHRCRAFNDVLCTKLKYDVTSVQI